MDQKVKLLFQSKQNNHLSVFQSLNDRWNLIQDPIHLMSYILDPRYCSIPIKEIYRRNGVAAIRKLIPQSEQNWFDGEIIKFRLKEFPYNLKQPLIAIQFSIGRVYLKQ